MFVLWRLGLIEGRFYFGFIGFLIVWVSGEIGGRGLFGGNFGEKWKWIYGSLGE